MIFSYLKKIWKKEKTSCWSCKSTCSRPGMQGWNFNTELTLALMFHCHARSFPLEVWKGARSNWNQKMTKKKHNSEPYMLILSSVNEVTCGSTTTLGTYVRTYDKRNKDIYCPWKYIRKPWAEVSSVFVTRSRLKSLTTCTPNSPDCM